MKVKLNKIVGVLDAMKDQQTSYLNKQTGAIITLEAEQIEAAKNGTGAPEGASEKAQEAVKRAAEVLKDTETYARLPLKSDIHEYKLMTNFSQTISNNTAAGMVKLSISGTGAFRRFKDVITRYGLADDWDQYKYQAIAKIAGRWCEKNGVEYE